MCFLKGLNSLSDKFVISLPSKKIFPDVEIDISLPSYEEFPPLVLPVTDHPAIEAMDRNKAAKEAFDLGDMNKALIEKRIECALLEKTDNFHDYFNSLIQFTEWCFSADKTKTAEESLEKLKQLETKLEANSIPEIIGFRKLLARVYTMKENYEKAAEEYELALEIYDNEAFEGQKNEIFYELTNGLGISLARLKKYKEAEKAFKKAKDYALLAIEDNPDLVVEYEIGPPIKYWPAIIRGLENKIKELRNTPVSLKEINAGPTKVE